MWAIYLLLHRERNILEEDFEDKRGIYGGRQLHNLEGLYGRPVIKCTNMKQTEEVECPELKGQEG